MKKELLQSVNSTNASRGNKNVYSDSSTDLVETSEEDFSNSSLNISSYISDWAARSFQKKNLVRKLPIINWLPEYNLTKLIADIIAGLTLGLTTIPQVLGVANVAELPPEYGLYSSFVGCFVYIFLGSTKYITIGPTVTTAIITLSYTKGQPPEFSVLLCFLTGVVTLFMSLFQLGFIVNFISKPVISGFTSAAAISIASTQIKSILGLSFNANGFINEIKGIIENIEDSQYMDIIVGFISLLSLFLLMKIEIIFKYFGTFSKGFNKFLWFLSTSRNVTVVIVATVIFGLQGDPPSVLVVGDVPSGMPPFKIPPFSYSEINNSTGETVEFSLGSALREKTTALIVIPLLAFMEHVTITKAFSGTSKVDATQELMCLGFSNIIGSFFSSIPVTGAFGRTALNYASGAQSPLGGLLTGIIIILALVVLTPQFYYIPKATLSSVVIMAVIFMVDFDIVLSIWRSKRMDLVPWGVTFLVSLFIGLEYGIMSGFAVSALFLFYYAARPGVRINKGQTGGEFEFLWVEVDRSMTFPSMEYTKYIVTKSATKWASTNLPVVIDCQYVAFADYTAAQGMSDLYKTFKEKGEELIFWQLKPSVKRIWSTVLVNNDVSAVFCSNEHELEMELERRLKSALEIKSAQQNLQISDDNNN